MVKTHSCEPTLTDSEVLKFCRDGYLVLEGVVPEETNHRTFEYLEDNTFRSPIEILQEDWFVDGVILNPEAVGAVRSILGNQFTLPIKMANHRSTSPMLAPQDWHRDGGSRYTCELDYLQVFYYPQDTPLDMGPTAVLPGSHFLYQRERHMGHYGDIRGAVYAEAPAGSIFLTIYSIWHRRAARTATASRGTRNLLKYNYWRTQAPKRDWVREQDFDFMMADYVLDTERYSELFRDTTDAAQMFFWLSGRADFGYLGGQGWPGDIPENKAPDGQRARGRVRLGYPGDITDWRRGG